MRASQEPFAGDDDAAPLDMLAALFEARGWPCQIEVPNNPNFCSLLISLSKENRTSIYPYFVKIRKADPGFLSYSAYFMSIFLSSGISAEVSW